MLIMVLSIIVLKWGCTTVFEAGMIGANRVCPAGSSKTLPAPAPPAPAPPSPPYLAAWQFSWKSHKPTSRKPSLCCFLNDLWTVTFIGAKCLPSFFYFSFCLTTDGPKTRLKLEAAWMRRHIFLNKSMRMNYTTVNMGAMAKEETLKRTKVLEAERYKSISLLFLPCLYADMPFKWWCIPHTSSVIFSILVKLTRYSLACWLN